MSRKFLALVLAGVTLAVSAAPISAAHADWRGYGRGGYGHGGYGRGGYGGYHGYRGRGIGPGAIVGGALLGLGVGALLAAPYAAPPPVVYAPPPVYYPPTYAYAPYQYAPPPPPVYYAPY